MFDTLKYQRWFVNRKIEKKLKHKGDKDLKTVKLIFLDKMYKRENKIEFYTLTDNCYPHSLEDINYLCFLELKKHIYPLLITAPAPIYLPNKAKVKKHHLKNNH